MIEIVQYETREGRCPFADWFDELDAQTAARIRTVIARIETGNQGDVKPVGEGVSERRIDVGPGYRIYFGQDGRRLLILLVGGTKKRQPRDIELAKMYWRDYKNRKQAGD
ncbi:type II toxin-antitoxin system RelE/ParE family toxin [Thiocystis violacea]|uniref:type II toxin-antitoxin system RelE/ParE family toxin n=1 Tax=Thiocystis violacea TaxID=13725 RepID=UPI001908E8D5|nr:type II toxin-antitoxin system RelE/ParE family toxin [Thiocystis violacea]MBK1716910.1 addiction module protein [Thiocystis violacea]